jgi:hypothetical protein
MTNGTFVVPAKISCLFCIDPFVRPRPDVQNLTKPTPVAAEARITTVFQSLSLSPHSQTFALTADCNGIWDLGLKLAHAAQDTKTSGPEPGTVQS